VEVKVFKSGLLQTNTYLVIKENNCIVIDPAFAYDKITRYIDKYKLRLLGVLLTHGHFDHIADASDVADKYNCKIYIAKNDLELIFDSHINGSKKYLRKDITIPKTRVAAFDKEIIMRLDNFLVDVLFTPGHSKGSCCYRIANELFTGDTLFEDGFGRVDLYGGSQEDLNKSLKYIFSLNNDTVVFPGHGDDTTIGEERKRYI
jgi:glyoxylase-like metal-dependent hydrolase (beta-lactamase superfamily II)